MSASEAAALAPDIRDDIRDLIIALADSKRLLGMRYAEWMLGAPEIEACIACASMAQDEWGHARLLYSLLKDFGDDPGELEHGRQPTQYRNIETLDAGAEDWPALIALNSLVDTALSVQFEALGACCYPPLRQRVEKLLEEERFHAAHGSAWLRRLAVAGERASARMRAAAEAVLPATLRWFGPDSSRAERMVEAAAADATGSDLRARYVHRVAPLLEDLDIAVAERATPDFDDFDEGTRRASNGGPDVATIERIRGDRNRVFLMD